MYGVGKYTLDKEVSFPSTCLGVLRVLPNTMSISVNVLGLDFRIFGANTADDVPGTFLILQFSIFIYREK